MVVEIIETDLAPGDYLFVPGELFEFGESCVVCQFGLVRVNADGGIYKRILLSQTDSAVEDRRTVTVADCHNSFDTSLASALDDLFAVGLELLAIKMGVRVDEHSN